MDIGPIRPVIKVLTNRYSWLAIGMAFGHFGLGALSPEWTALVDLGTVAATALLAIFPEKGQWKQAKQEESAHDQSNNPGADAADRVRSVALPADSQAGSDVDNPRWFDNQ